MLVYRLLNPLGFVAFKMCRRSGLGRTVRQMPRLFPFTPESEDVGKERGSQR
jgi:hypothetical protein